jgi:hypothetical protein
MYGNKKSRVSPDAIRRRGQIVLYLLWPLVLALAIVLVVVAVYVFE